MTQEGTVTQRAVDEVLQQFSGPPLAFDDEDVLDKVAKVFHIVCLERLLHDKKFDM